MMIVSKTRGQKKQKGGTKRPPPPSLFRVKGAVVIVNPTCYSLNGGSRKINFSGLHTIKPQLNQLFNVKYKNKYLYLFLTI